MYEELKPPTLRQQYAMSAITGLLACDDVAAHPRAKTWQESAALHAFDIADAMLAAESFDIADAAFSIAIDGDKKH